MSFNKSYTADLESHDAASAHYKDFPDFETISKSIDEKLHHVNSRQLVAVRSALRRYEEALAGDNDNNKMAAVQSVAREITELSSQCTESFKALNNEARSLNEYLVQCQRNHEDEDAISYLKQKEALSVSLIKNSLKQFQKLQLKFNGLQKQNVATQHVAEETAATPTAEQAQPQIQITYEPVNAEELEQQTLLIEEREREIQQISNDTQEVNDIFSNLQDIIHEQQFQIDNIEENIMSYSTDTRGASRELHKAERYQRRSGARMFCCLLILLGVLGLIVFIGVVF